MKKYLFYLGLCLAFGVQGQSQTVVDYDGNNYDTVHIGTQVWLKQNLKVTHYNDGVAIPNVTDSVVWGGLNTGARCYYGNDSSAMDSVYGVLYNWYAATNSKKICPTGYHVATDGQWTALENYLGGSFIAGGPLKEAGFLHWLSPNYGATNSTGFTGLPGGFRGLDNAYQTIFENGLWWTSSSQSGGNAWSRYMWYMNDATDRNPTLKTLGMSIRCLMDVNIGIGTIHKPNLKIYPNPSREVLSIECPSGNISQLTLFNMLGKTIWHNERSCGIQQIDISDFPAGVYFVQLGSALLYETVKFIKE